MDLKIYNTLSRTIETFEPINKDMVTFYACGPTVYDKTHIGHIRKYFGDDILRRTLGYIGYNVNHVMNITDVGHLVDDADDGEDKLEKGAKKENKSVWDIAKMYTDYFHDTMHAVHILPPTHETKATDHISEMIELVQTLLEKGFAYETEFAIYFDTSKDEEYGKLSGQKLDQKEVAVRDDVVIDTNKKNPNDFSLWFKKVGRFADHSMSWESPWGPGFPGWHIECSAMSMKYLGETIDLHSGGIDHIPVHHENEIAQSECATGKTFVKYWIHHQFLLVDGEKMSKSKENFYTVEDIKLHGIDPLATRIMFLQTSYRKPTNFTWESLEAANDKLKELQKFASLQKEIGNVIENYKNDFAAALCEDLNTAKALSIVWEVLSDTTHSQESIWATLLDFDQVLGLNLQDVPKFVITDDAQKLVDARNTARIEKNWELSDTLRKELETLGYVVKDTPEGTVLN